eukprot:m.336868 g.336868  ORF g.336868 m.336868 type:complete len:295 (-) comp17983_c0_seq1:68-952(-)
MMGAQNDLVLYDVSPEGVAIVTLNRPKRNNAYTDPLGASYFARLKQANNDPNVKAIVLTGAGKSFCVGADMNVLQSASGSDAQENATKEKQVEHQHMEQILALRLNKPLIACINGACAGIGLVTALMADVRFAAAGAKFTTAFSRRGLVAEHGSSWILPRIVGYSNAMDLLISGRTILAEEAHGMGLVNFVVPSEKVMQETMKYATDLAVNVSPASMAAIKHQVLEASEEKLRPSFDRAASLMLRSFGHSDFKEGVMSYMERRKPTFEGVQGSDSTKYFNKEFGESHPVGRSKL